MMLPHKLINGRLQLLTDKSDIHNIESFRNFCFN